MARKMRERKSRSKRRDRHCSFNVSTSCGNMVRSIPHIEPSRCSVETIEKLQLEYLADKDAVENKRLSPEEGPRINVETQTLTESIRDTKSKIQALIATSYEHEIQSAKRSDEI